MDVMIDIKAMFDEINKVYEYLKNTGDYVNVGWPNIIFYYDGSGEAWIEPLADDGDIPTQEFSWGKGDDPVESIKYAVDVWFAIEKARSETSEGDE
jgi:hypothetical protein